MEAKLIPVQIEVPAGRSYRWVEGFKVVTPEGKELQPHMRKRAAQQFCKTQGWNYKVAAE